MPHPVAHIGIDATCWHNQRGYGRHARALLTRVIHQGTDYRFTLFSDLPAPDGWNSVRAEWRQVAATRPTVEAASADGHRSLRDMARMSYALSDRSLDLLVYPTVYSFVPSWGRARRIVMIHDVIAERFPTLTIPHRLGRWLWRTKVAWARRQADAIVTVSDHARDEIAREFRLDPRRIQVVGEAPDGAFRCLPREATATAALQQKGLLGPFRLLLYVGGFNPHKNLETLLRAFAPLVHDPAYADVRLVLVGDTNNRTFHSYIDSVRGLVRLLDLDDRVIFTGFLADEDLAALMNRATALVLPSLMEGYGLPAVEGAACGLPVLATSVSPLPQLLADGGLFLSPTDVSAWELGMRRILSDEPFRREAATRARTAASRLTWDAAADQMLAVFAHLLNSNDTRRSTDVAHARSNTTRSPAEEVRR